MAPPSGKKCKFEVCLHYVNEICEVKNKDTPWFATDIIQQNNYVTFYKPQNEIWEVDNGSLQMLIPKILQIFSSLIRVISESISRNKQLGFCKRCTMSCQSWYNFVSYFPKGVKANLIFFLYR